MVSSDTILSKLSPYLKNQQVLVKTQTVGDIKNGIRQWHEKYKSEYDKIYKNFLGKSAEDSARNVYDFLRDNVSYNIESEDVQTLRSPAAIIAPGRTMGADCKNYSLFSAGVLDAINRNTTQRIPVAFRFASYDMFSSIPKHVFTVVNPGTQNEIWVDPVLPYFNDKKQPTYYTDKKIKSMALVALSGLGDTPTADQVYNGMKQEFAGLVNRGRLQRGTKLYNEYVSMINTYADRLGKPRIGAIVGVFGWDDAIALIPSVINMFSQQDNSQAWSTTASKDDWGWWLVKDPSNHPANNFIVYFSKHPEFLKVGLGANPDTGVPYTISQKQQIMRDRLTAAGYGTQITALLNAWNQLYDLNGNPKSGTTPGGVISPNPPATNTNAGMNMWLTIGLVGAGIFAISKMKK